MIIAFIPARGGSKSIPIKNIKPFCGKPLLHWSIDALQNSKKIDAIHISTDSSEIADCVSNYQDKRIKVFHRDPANATDEASTESAMLEFIHKMDLNREDLFILVQATSPFISGQDIDQAIGQMNDENSDSLLSCVRYKRFLWNESGTPLNYQYTNRPRRQDFKGTFLENGAFYINSVANIIESKNRLSGKISIFEMEPHTSIEIDEPEDWIAAEEIMHRMQLDKSAKKNIKLFLSDVDGTLTDGGMFYDTQGNELKKFSTIDGMAFSRLSKAGIITGLITSETTKIVEARAKKLKVNHLRQGLHGHGKLSAAKQICKEENLSLSEVAYIGDDINCIEILRHVGSAACPSNARDEVKRIPGIIKLETAGGSGAVREFAEIILNRT